MANAEPFQNDVTFTPRRKLALLPNDATTGIPMTLPAVDLCDVCINAVVQLSSATATDTTEETIHTLPRIDVIRKSRGCKLCTLLTQALDGVVPPYAIESARREDAHILLRIAEHAFGPEIIVSDGEHNIARIDEVLPSISPNLFSSSNQIDFGLIRDWLLECEGTHDCSWHAQLDRFTEKPISVILIDVKERKLVGPYSIASRITPYCALSYVCGQGTVFKTSKSILNQLRQPHALDNPDLGISPLFQDAMALVDNIGQRYLWIDALCIVQDDEKQLHDDISHMDSIYQFAVLTIAVIATVDASNNIPGVLPATRAQLPAAQIHGRELYVKPVPLHLAMLGSRYESRAWTFQERLLANKCLFISDWVVYFSCENMLCSELDSGVGLHVNVIPTVINPLRTLESYRNPKETSPDYLREREIKHDGIGEMSARSFLSPYFELVRQYSQRSLTYESDVYHAFTGIMVRLQHAYIDLRFQAGLPDKNPIVAPLVYGQRDPSFRALEAALHWIPGSKRLERREGADSLSWSWAGWVGAIEWLEAVVLPHHWEWDLATMGFVGSGHLHLHTRRIPATIWRFHGLPGNVFPERIFSPGNGSPLPLTAILDLEGRWCGWLCDHPLLEPLDESFELVLISTCRPRLHLVKRNTRPEQYEYMHLFDTKEFAIDGRLWNMIMIKRKGNVAERVALCQIHVDAILPSVRSEKGIKLA
jgi:hypothetical protein